MVFEQCIDPACIFSGDAADSYVYAYLFAAIQDKEWKKNNTTEKRKSKNYERPKDITLNDFKHGQ